MVHVRGIGLDSGPAHILPFAIFPLGLLPRLVSLAVSRSEGRSVFRSRIALLQIEMKLFCAQRRKLLNCPHVPRFSLVTLSCPMSSRNTENNTMLVENNQWNQVHSISVEPGLEPGTFCLQKTLSYAPFHVKYSLKELSKIAFFLLSFLP